MDKPFLSYPCLIHSLFSEAYLGSLLVSSYGAMWFNTGQNQREACTANGSLKASEQTNELYASAHTCPLVIFMYC